MILRGGGNHKHAYISGLDGWMPEEQFRGGMFEDPPEEFFQRVVCYAGAGEV